MAVEVSWSDEAIKSFDRNIEYLLGAWSEKEVKSFVLQTQYVITRLKEHPESYNPSLKIRK